MTIQFVDLTGFFKGSDKDGGIQKTILRVYPTSKSFHATERLRNRADNRLIENLDVAFFNRFVNVVHDVVLQNKGFLQIFVIIANKVIAGFFLYFARNFCLIARI